MLLKHLRLFIPLFLLPVLLLAQDGKLRGKVADKESGEPLIGANVVIEGTNLGASTDINGEYIILSVPPGVYSVKASYIGYAATTVENIRVNSNITTTLDFMLSSSAVQAREVVVVAERPLIQRNTTNTVRLQTQEDIQNIPLRGVQSIVALNAGVVRQGDLLYVRGGRAGEVAYYLDGANITNRYNGLDDNTSQNVTIIQEALEEIQVQTGGMTAEFGGANSGIIRATTRSGGSAMKLSIDYRTDDFAKPGKSFLGNTYSYGFRNAVATLGGPLGSGIRFFLAGQHNYLRNNRQMFTTPFSFDTLRDDGVNLAANKGKLLPGPVALVGNYFPGNWNQNNSAQGNLLFDLQPFKVRFSGAYAFAESQSGADWPGYLGNIFRLNRLSRNETQTYLGNVRITHVLNPQTFYEVGVSYQSRAYKNYDPLFGDNWRAYADSQAAADAGLYTGQWRNRYAGPVGISTILNFGFNDPNTPNNSFTKSNQNGWGFTADLTSQVTPTWELKAGGSIDAWVYRYWSVGSISGLRNFLDPNRKGVDAPDSIVNIKSEYERRIRWYNAGSIVMYGYDFKGNKTDGYTLDGSSATLDAPYKPLNASAYVQNKFEFKDLILNVGVRYEYYSPKFKTVPKSINPVTGQYDFDYIPGDDYLKVIDESLIGESAPTSLVLPRINFSYPVTERTVFYAQYGKFAQFASYGLGNLYQSSLGFNAAVNPISRSPYSGSVAFDVLPERTTAFESGIRQILTDNLAFTLTGFYKDTKDQIQIRRHFNSLGNADFTAYQNGDFGTVKGIEFTLDLRRTNRLSARVNYTLSSAQGTGSFARSGAVATSDELKAIFPNFIGAEPFDQTHVGSVMLDYRWAKGDGGDFFEGMGFNALLTFNSGHRYTKIAEPQNLGQASPWNIGVYPLRDARFRNPVEPINASTTPWFFNIDMTVNKIFYFGDVSFEIYANILNLLNTRNVINVFPNTGTSNDDGWLKSPFSESYKAIPNYEAFYRALNLDNRYFIMQYVGDTYSPPRQIRFGVRLDY